jgi:hypothetical protein
VDRLPILCDVSVLTLKEKMMESKIKKEIEIHQVTHGNRKYFKGPGLPLEDLYYWDTRDAPVNEHELAFAGDNLFASQAFQQIEEIRVSFYGESDDERYREAWADPLRLEILRNLAGKHRRWYIGYKSCWSMAIFDNCSEILLDMHVTGLSVWELSKVAIVDSGYRIGMGKGIVKKPIFEVGNKDLDDFVKQVWQAADPSFSIEGYCLEPGKLDRLRVWDKQQKNDDLFRQVIDECLILFYTYPSEPRHFHFITNKMDTEEMAGIINLEDLQKRAASL